MRFLIITITTELTMKHIYKVYQFTKLSSVENILQFSTNNRKMPFDTLLNPSVTHNSKISDTVILE